MTFIRHPENFLTKLPFRGEKQTPSPQRPQIAGQQVPWELGVREPSQAASLSGIGARGPETRGWDRPRPPRVRT